MADDAAAQDGQRPAAGEAAHDSRVAGRPEQAGGRLVGRDGVSWSLYIHCPAEGRCAVRLRAGAVCAACLIWALPSVDALAGGEQSYELVFSTYAGGKNWEHARDVCADKDGNVYMVGGTSSPDFPTTPGAYDRTFHDGGKGTGAAGLCDAFVMEFSPEGKLIWSTLLGGPGYDRAYGVEVDAKGYVYVTGRCGPDFPVTPGAFQTKYRGRTVSFYGSQNAFVAKLKPDGSGLVWSSYVGTCAGCRDLAIDADGNVYLPLAISPGRGDTPDWYAKAFSKAFQAKPAGGLDVGVVKVHADGVRVLWATWLAGSGNESGMVSVRVDAQRNVCVVCGTQSKDMPTSDGAHDRTCNGKGGPYYGKLSTDGQRLLFGTYLGGSGTDIACNTHNLAVDAEGNVYGFICTNSADFPTTPGAFDRTYNGGGEVAVVKLSPTGALLASTFIGGKGEEGGDGIYVDKAGNVFFTGHTKSTDFPTTPGAFQAVHGGAGDAFVAVLSADFRRLLYSTYMGGKAGDVGRSACLGPDGSLCVTGSANGPGWPVRNAFQATFAGSNDPRWGNGDCILARFRPTPRAGPQATPEVRRRAAASARAKWLSSRAVTKEIAVRCAVICPLVVLMLAARASLAVQPVFPGPDWQSKSPAQVGLDASKLKAFSDFTAGRGCVTRHGYMVYAWGNHTKPGDVASACKPFFSHFLFKALEEGKVPSLDEKVVRYEPRLGQINKDLGFKDKDITWRHFATQTSCYQVTDKPGSAFCYNDWQMALFWDLLFTRVYGADYATVDEKVLRPLLTDAIGCQDKPTMMAFGLKDRPGRVKISPRDFCRFGLLYLNRGQWNGKSLLNEKLAVMAVTRPLLAALPRASRKLAEIIPGQRSLGSTEKPDNQCPHQGSYSFLWWVNGLDEKGKRLWPGVPEDAYGAFGHGGPRAMALIPSLGLVVSWNDAKLKGWEQVGRAIKLCADAVTDRPAATQPDKSVVSH